MSEASPPPEPGSPGLIARVFGVIASPRETFAAVAARPRVLGVLLLTVAVAAGSQYWFLSSENGRKATLEALEGQARMMESLTGNAMSDADYDRMMAGADSAATWGTGATLVSIPITILVLSAVFLGIFNGMLGGSASFKQVCAVVAHAGVVWTLVSVFNAVMGFYTGRATGTSSLAVFFPMIDKGFLASLLGYVDLLWLWAFFTTAVGLAVLYRRATGPIASTLIGLYLTIGVLYAAVRSIAGA